MKKQTKIISIVLALMLAISAFAVMSLAVNAAEDSEDYSESTQDTPTAAVDHIELISLPTRTEYYNGVVELFTLDGLEYNVYYADGTVKNYSDSDYDECVAIKYTDSDGNVVIENSEYSVSVHGWSIGEHTITLLYCERDPEDYWSYDYENAIEFAEYTINVAEDPFVSEIKSIEIIKVPDKVFTEECLINGEPDNYGQNYWDQYYKNSLWFNMNGAKLEITFTDGTTDVYDFFTEDGWYPIFVYQGREITIHDLGGYKAEVSLAGHTTVFEANHTGAEPTNPNNSNTNLTDPSASQNQNANLSSADTAKSSTSDTATADTSIKSNADNGTIATGSVMCSFAAIIILVSACGVLVFFNRKRYSGKN